ncbi:MAG: response regulator receiver [Comamonadaceae bacterium]|nr:MAG: response regulator receiver [Comamonadaceae bacterium]
MKWEAYVKSPSFESFVEFAVSLSSFAEFLQGKGLSGLHRLSHNLEQQVLALFDAVDKHHVSQDTLDELQSRIEALSERVTEFMDSNGRSIDQRRAHPEAGLLAESIPSHRVWLICDHASQWQALTTRLAYFSIQTEVYPWEKVPDKAHEPSIVLLDTHGMSVKEVCRHIQTMRTRFAASKLIAHRLAADFNTLKAVLRAGCDYCFNDSTPQSTILAKIIELCSKDEEPPFRVLVVEDSPTASKSIQHTLRESGIESLAVMNPSDVLIGLRSFQPDLILMDMYMPDCTGVEATRVIRQHAEFLSTPVVYLSGDGDMALQVDALRLGGDHFLTKPFNPVFLNAVVKSKIERYRTLRRSMLRDGLTGLFNHRTIKERLAAAVTVTSNTHGRLAVAMIDIDHFKSVNDKYGHPMGDEVIRSLAWLLKQRLRKGDLVGRYGGEEFLVILPGSDAEQAFDVLDRIRRDFSQIRYSLEDGWFETTFSAGVSQYFASTNAEAMIKDADEALYDAKHSGRNCVVTRG